MSACRLGWEAARRSEIDINQQEHSGTKNYYEAHVTFTCPSDEFITHEEAKNIVLGNKWRFSAIDGDSNLGAGVKLYATRQFNRRNAAEKIVTLTQGMADILEQAGAKIHRRKVEVVIYDDRIDKVGCTGGCPECHIDDLQVHLAC